MDSKELSVHRYYLKDGNVFKMDRVSLSNLSNNGEEFRYEPILLNNDWFEWLGLLERYVSYARQLVFNGNVYLFSSEDSVNVPIKYVHELQKFFYEREGFELELYMNMYSENKPQ